MAQMQWTYLDGRGGQHRVGLYHGDHSGHVLIHCNMRVVQIDFSVKDTRMYSFFIEDDLCELLLEKQPDGLFGYEFRINKEVDTPRNRERKTLLRRDNRHVAWFAAGLLLLLAIAFAGLKWYGHEQRKKQMTTNSLFNQASERNAARLGKSGQSAEAQLLVVQEKDGRQVYYAFVTADSMRVSGQFAAPDTGAVMLPTGFPLADRDAFAVRYLPENPQVHRLDFNQPTRSTLEAYVRRAVAAEQRAHPQASPAHAACLVQIAYRAEGWPALGHFLCQSLPPLPERPYHRDTYLRLIRDPGFVRQAQSECWDQ
ncbi:MAG TPA: hypothetical protein PKD78_10320 [Saprospiraceae bacterium]|nr:hypothetical protein [Saprospiraceae bacterium]